MVDQEDSEAPQISRTKRCLFCDEEIQVFATKCIKCQSDLSWRGRYLGFSGTILALLSTLVSVTGLVIPIIVHELEAKSSNIRLIFDSDGLATNGYLSFNFVASNSGIRPGTVHFGAFYISLPRQRPQDDEHIIKLELGTRDGTPYLIQPGSVVIITLYSATKLDKTDALYQRFIATNFVDDLHTSCYFTVNITDFSGTTRSPNIDLNPQGDDYCYPRLKNTISILKGV